MKKDKGFTLIELMIVVAIIAIIAAIAIPNLLRSRMQSNESSAIGNLRTIIGAETAYAAANSAYGDLTALTSVTPQYLPGAVAAWTTTGKNGYTFAVTGASATNFNSNANPLDSNSGTRYFFADASGVIRFNKTAQASATDSPIGE
jgi:prepilin-type N-terminal cleavage/methylation domain-containing protein